MARDPETFAIRPLLATSWKYVDDTTLELELRKGVKFQDGSAFSASEASLWAFWRRLLGPSTSSLGS